MHRKYDYPPIRANWGGQLGGGREVGKVLLHNPSQTEKRKEEITPIATTGNQGRKSGRVRKEAVRALLWGSKSTRKLYF